MKILLLLAVAGFSLALASCDSEKIQCRTHTDAVSCSDDARCEWDLEKSSCHKKAAE